MSNFISSYNLICSKENLDSRGIFSIISSVLIISLISTGFLSDRYGRKRVIIIKSLILITLLVTLCIVGFINKKLKEIAIPTYFISLAFATLTIDISLLEIESTPKKNRDNLIILLSVSRLGGIGIICLLFYFLSKWVYSIVIVTGIIIICLPLFIKFLYESPYFVLATTGNIENCKYIVNQIGEVNDEESLQEKIAFSYNQQTIRKRRSVIFSLKNIFNCKLKLFTLSVISMQWFAYFSGQMLQIVFLEKIAGDNFLNLSLIAITEILATLFSKVPLNYLGRKMVILICNGLISFAFLFLLIFPESNQCIYAVTLITRVSLAILINALQLLTFEQFPTEARAFCTSICMSLGLTVGVGLPFVKQLNSQLILTVLLVFVTSSIAIYFARETKTEKFLYNLYCEIFPDTYQQLTTGPKDQLKKKEINKKSRSDRSGRENQKDGEEGQGTKGLSANNSFSSNQADLYSDILKELNNSKLKLLNKSLDSDDKKQAQQQKIQYVGNKNDELFEIQENGLCSEDEEDNDDDEDDKENKSDSSNEEKDSIEQSSIQADDIEMEFDEFEADEGGLEDKINRINNY